MTNPKYIEQKELFTVVVHASQFTVSARRVHGLLHPDQPYESWMQVVILRAALELNRDYWYRDRAVDQPKRRHHGIVFELNAIKKLCILYIGDAHASEEQEDAARKLLKEAGVRQQQLLQTSLSYAASYWVHDLPFKARYGQRIYPLKKVLKGLDAVPAFELTLRQQFPHHITPFYGVPYISYELVQLLHMRRWMAQYRQAVAAEQPFANEPG